MNSPVVDVFGQALPLAVALALSPMPIIAIVLLLMSARGRTAAVLFLLGRVVALAAVLGVVLVASDYLYGLTSGVELPTIVKLVLGAALVVLGLTKWRPKPAGVEPSLPAWMSAVGDSTPGRGFVFGIILTVANPKELAFLITVGATIGGAALLPLEALWVALLFVAVAILSLLVPVVATLAAPARMRPVLERLRDWLTAHSSVVMGVLLIVIGAVVFGGALSEL